MIAKDLYTSIQDSIQKLPLNEFMLSADEAQLRSAQVERLVQTACHNVSSELGKRIQDEFYGWGPLQELLHDESITEIIINGPYSIWSESAGILKAHSDVFLSELSFRNILDRMSHAAKTHISTEHPCADGSFLDFRISIIGSELTRSHPHLTLRRHPKSPWTFKKLHAQGWCSDDALDFFKTLVESKKNFLVIGPTGAGKTSALNSFLKLLPENERVVVIEDTPEISLPNPVSMKLLTREDPQGVLPSIDQTQLVKRSLRLRPDRIVMGEIRGAEAKDFLMALATGHAGSFGTLHAQDAGQALIRLEMLIQMGAPQWSLQAIRRLIQLSLDYVIVTGREPSGKRIFKGAYRLCSLEEQGVLLEADLLR